MQRSPPPSVKWAGCSPVENIAGGARERGNQELNLEDAHLYPSNQPTCQVPEIYSFSQTPSPRIPQTQLLTSSKDYLSPQTPIPNCLFCFLFCVPHPHPQDISMTLFYLWLRTQKTSFGQSAGEDPASSNPTDTICYIPSTVVLKPPRKASTFYLGSFGAARVGVLIACTFSLEHAGCGRIR